MTLNSQQLIAQHLILTVLRRTKDQMRQGDLIAAVQAISPTLHDIDIKTVLGEMHKSRIAICRRHVLPGDIQEKLQDFHKLTAAGRKLAQSSDLPLASRSSWKSSSLARLNYQSRHSNGDS